MMGVTVTGRTMLLDGGLALPWVLVLSPEIVVDEAAMAWDGKNPNSDFEQVENA